MSSKYVYDFEEGNAAMRALLGGKGADLAEIANLGLVVPPGFTITTAACKDFLQKNNLSDTIWHQIENAVHRLELKTNRQFNSFERPLLVSVRSGAPVSMPGMMDTILNLGLNDETVKALAKTTGNERFAYDCYRRFIQMFGNIVLGIEKSEFENIYSSVKSEKGVKFDIDLDGDDLKKIVALYKKLIASKGLALPSEPKVQLKMAVEAVFNSWNNPRAITYRKLNHIDDSLGTAVNVQAMVYGNLNVSSGSGVAFTRNPATGEKKLYGEFLLNAQGEDVVAGVRTPLPIATLQGKFPAIYAQLAYVAHQLEKHFKDMQDLEFTVENEKLYILQTRSGKRTSLATIKIAVDMAKEGLITKGEAILAVKPEDITSVLHTRIDWSKDLQKIAKGLNASPGAVCGQVVFDTDKAAELGKEGVKVILVRPETTPDDIHGIAGAAGVLTAKGGMTSHAAVVTRGMGKPCVCGCEGISIDIANSRFEANGIVVKEGDLITIDGTTGDVVLGEAPLLTPEPPPELAELLRWADEIRTLSVMANADTPESAKKARELGADGIGLCRTERMFNQPDRLPFVRKMILAADSAERTAYANKLLPLQKEDFKQIFRVMEGLPVTIRLLDPPLHEFLPSQEELMKEISYLREFHEVFGFIESLPETIKLLNPALAEYLPALKKVIEELKLIKNSGLDESFIQSKEALFKKVQSLHEINPMLGHRGVRLGITYPEIYEMQIKAILEAAAELIKEGVAVKPEIMVPQVCTSQELVWVHEKVQDIKSKVESQYSVTIPLKFGTMIEVVRACMRAGRFAEIVDFFSFGTNDLTQATFSFSREDAEKKFLPLYQKEGILHTNPFEVLDADGVGQLMKTAVEWGRKTNPNLKIGICGEHGGEPNSIKFCHDIGLNYVSCSPYRIQIARLATARAKLLEKS